MEEQPIKHSSPAESLSNDLPGIAPNSSPPPLSDSSDLSQRPKKIDKWSEEFWQLAFQSKDRQQSLERLADIPNEDEEYLSRLAARKPLYRKPVTSPDGKTGRAVSRSADSSPQGGLVLDVGSRGSERGLSRAAREFWKQSVDGGTSVGIPNTSVFRKLDFFKRSQQESPASRAPDSNPSPLQTRRSAEGLLESGMPAPSPNPGASQAGAEILPVVKETVAAIFDRVTDGAPSPSVAPGNSGSTHGKGGLVSEGFAALQNLGGNAAAMFAAATGSGSPGPAETDPRERESSLFSHPVSPSPSPSPSFDNQASSSLGERRVLRAIKSSTKDDVEDLLGQVVGYNLVGKDSPPDTQVAPSRGQALQKRTSLKELGVSTELPLPEEEDVELNILVTAVLAAANEVVSESLTEAKEVALELRRTLTQKLGAENLPSRTSPTQPATLPSSAASTSPVAPFGRESTLPAFGGRERAVAARLSAAAPAGSAPPAGSPAPAAAATTPLAAEELRANREAAAAAAAFYTPADGSAAPAMTRVPSGKDLATAARLAVVGPPPSAAVESGAKDTPPWRNVSEGTKVESAGGLPRVLSGKDLAVAARLAVVGPPPSAGVGSGAKDTPPSRTVSEGAEVESAGGLPRVLSGKDLAVAARLAVTGPSAVAPVAAAEKVSARSTPGKVSAVGEEQEVTPKLPRVLSGKDLATVARLTAGAPDAVIPTADGIPPGAQIPASVPAASGPKDPVPGVFTPEGGGKMPRVPSGKDLATAVRIAVVPATAPGATRADGASSAPLGGAAAAAAAAVSAAAAVIGGGALSGRDAAVAARNAAVAEPVLALPLRLSCGADHRFKFVQGDEKAAGATTTQVVPADKARGEPANAPGVGPNPIQVWASYLQREHPEFAEEAQKVVEAIEKGDSSVISAAANLVAHLKEAHPALADKLLHIGAELRKKGDLLPVPAPGPNGLVQGKLALPLRLSCGADHRFKFVQGDGKLASAASPQGMPADKTREESADAAGVGPHAMHVWAAYLQREHPEFAEEAQKVVEAIDKEDLTVTSATANLLAHLKDAYPALASKLLRIGAELLKKGDSLPVPPPGVEGLAPAGSAPSTEGKMPRVMSGRDLATAARINVVPTSAPGARGVDSTPALQVPVKPAAVLGQKVLKEGDVVPTPVSGPRGPVEGEYIPDAGAKLLRVPSGKDLATATRIAVVPASAPSARVGAVAPTDASLGFGGMAGPAATAVAALAVGGAASGRDAANAARLAASVGKTQGEPNAATEAAPGTLVLPLRLSCGADQRFKFVRGNEIPGFQDQAPATHVQKASGGLADGSSMGGNSTHTWASYLQCDHPEFAEEAQSIFKALKDNIPVLATATAGLLEHFKEAHPDVAERVARVGAGLLKAGDVVPSPAPGPRGPVVPGQYAPDTGGKMSRVPSGKDLATATRIAVVPGTAPGARVGDVVPTMAPESLVKPGLLLGAKVLKEGDVVPSPVPGPRGPVAGEFTPDSSGKMPRIPSGKDLASAARIAAVGAKTTASAVDTPGDPAAAGAIAGGAAFASLLGVALTGTAAGTSGRAAGNSGVLDETSGNQVSKPDLSPSERSLKRRETFTPTPSLDDERDGVWPEPQALRKGPTGVDVGVTLGAGGSLEKPKGWPAPTPRSSLAAVTPTGAVAPEGISPNLDGLEDALKLISPRGSEGDESTLAGQGGAARVPPLKLGDLNPATAKAGAARSETSGIIPRLQIGGTDGTPARVLGVDLEARSSATINRLPSLGLNFPEGAARTPPKDIAGEVITPLAGASAAVPESSPTSTVLSSKMQAIASQGADIASNRLLRAPSANLDAMLDFNPAGIPTAADATPVAPTPDAPVSPSSDTADTTDQGEDGGRRPSWRNRLMQATKSFRTTGRKELSRDKLVPPTTNAERSDASGMSPPAATRGRAASGNLDALLAGGGTSGGVEGLLARGDEPPMVTAREIMPPGAKLPLLGTAGLAGATAAVGTALVAGNGPSGAGGGKKGSASANAVAPDVDSVFAGASEGRSGVADLGPEHADIDDILASTTSQGESRRWATQGGLRTFSLLSTETDDFEALLEEFEPTGTAGSMDLYNAEAALIGAKNKLDTTAEELSKLEPPTADPGSPPHKGSVLTGFAWRRSRSSSALRAVPVPAESREKPITTPLSVTTHVGGYPAPFSSSGSTPTAFDLPEVPHGGTERPHEGVFGQILAGLGGGSAASAALSLPEYPGSVGLSTDEEVPSSGRHGSPAVPSRISAQALAPFSNGGGPVSPTGSHLPREKIAFKPASILSSGSFSGVDVPSATVKQASTPGTAAPSAKADVPDLPGRSESSSKESEFTANVAGDVGGSVTLPPAVGVALTAAGVAAVGGALGATAAADVLAADGTEAAKELPEEPVAGLERKRSFAQRLGNRLGFGRNKTNSSEGNSPVSSSASTPKASGPSTPSMLGAADKVETPKASFPVTTPDTLEVSASQLPQDAQPKAALAGIVTPATLADGASHLHHHEQPKAALTGIVTPEVLSDGASHLHHHEQPKAALTGIITPVNLADGVAHLHHAPDAAGPASTSTASPSDAPSASTLAAGPMHRQSSAAPADIDVLMERQPSAALPVTGLTAAIPTIDSALGSAPFPSPMGDTSASADVAGAISGSASVAGAKPLKATGNARPRSSDGPKPNLGLATGAVAGPASVVWAKAGGAEGAGGRAARPSGEGTDDLLASLTPPAGAVPTPVKTAESVLPSGDGQSADKMADPFAASPPLVAPTGSAAERVGDFANPATMGLGRASMTSPGKPVLEGPGKVPSDVGGLGLTSDAGKPTAATAAGPAVGDRVGDIGKKITEKGAGPQAGLDPKTSAAAAGKEGGGGASLMAPPTPSQKEIISVAAGATGKDQSPLAVSSLLDELHIPTVMTSSSGAAPKEISRTLDFSALPATPKSALKAAAPLEADLLGLGTSDAALPAPPKKSVSFSEINDVFKEEQAGSSATPAAGEDAAETGSDLWEGFKGVAVPFMASAYSSLGNGLAQLSALLETASRDDDVSPATRAAAPAEEDLGARAAAAAKKAAKTAGMGLSSVARAASELSSSAGQTYKRDGLNTPNSTVAAGVIVPVLVLMLISLPIRSIFSGGNQVLPATAKGAATLPAQPAWSMFGGTSSTKPHGFDPTAGETKRGWWGPKTLPKAPDQSAKRTTGKKGGKLPKSSGWFGKAPVAEDLDEVASTGSWWGSKPRKTARSGKAGTKGSGAAPKSTKKSGGWFGSSDSKDTPMPDVSSSTPDIGPPTPAAEKPSATWTSGILGWGLRPKPSRGALSKPQDTGAVPAKPITATVAEKDIAAIAATESAADVAAKEAIAAEDAKAAAEAAAAAELAAAAAKATAESKAKRKAARAAKAKEAAELKTKQEAEEELGAAERARLEGEAQAKQQAEEKAAAELKAKQEEELKAKQEADLKAKEEADVKAKQEEELKAKQEVDLKVKQEADLKAKEEADVKAKQEEELKAKQDVEVKAKQDAMIKAKQEAEVKAKEEEELRIKQEAEVKANEEAEAQARAVAAAAEAETKARRELAAAEAEAAKVKAEAVAQKAKEVEGVKAAASQAAGKEDEAAKPASTAETSLSDALLTLSKDVSKDAAGAGILSSISQSAAALGLARLASWGLRGDVDARTPLTTGQTPDTVARGSPTENPAARWLASLPSFTRGPVEVATPDAHMPTADGPDGTAGAAGDVGSGAAGVLAGIEAGAVSLAAYIPTLDSIKDRMPTLEGIKDRLPSLKRLPSLADLHSQLTGLSSQAIRDTPKVEPAVTHEQATPRSWALPTLDSVRTLLPASESLPDLGAYVPTYAGAKERLAAASAYIPSRESLGEYVPTYAAAKDRLAAASAYIPSDLGLPDLTAYMPTSAGAKERLAAASAYVPTLDGLKSALPTLPSFKRSGSEDVATSAASDAPDTGVVARLRSLSSGLPSMNDVTARLPTIAGLTASLPAGADILKRMPTLESARSYMPSTDSLPTWENIRASVPVGAVPKSLTAAYARLPSFGSSKGPAAGATTPKSTKTLPSWADIKARAMGALPTVQTLTSKLPSIDLSSIRGSLPSGSALSKQVSEAIARAKGSAASMSKKLPSVAGLAASIPSVADLMAHVPRLESLTASLAPAFHSVTARLPSLSGLSARLPSLAALGGYVPSIGAIEAGMIQGLRNLGSYGRRAVGGGNAAYDPEIGTALVVAAALGIILALMAFDEAASARVGGAEVQGEGENPVDSLKRAAREAAESLAGGVPRVTSRSLPADGVPPTAASSGDGPLAVTARGLLPVPATAVGVTSRDLPAVVGTSSGSGVVVTSRGLPPPVAGGSVSAGNLITLDGPAVAGAAAGMSTRELPRERPTGLLGVSGAAGAGSVMPGGGVVETRTAVASRDADSLLLDPTGNGPAGGAAALLPKGAASSGTKMGLTPRSGASEIEAAGPVGIPKGGSKYAAEGKSGIGNLLAPSTLSVAKPAGTDNGLSSSKGVDASSTLLTAAAGSAVPGSVEGIAGRTGANLAGSTSPALSPILPAHVETQAAASPALNKEAADPASGALQKPGGIVSATVPGSGFAEEAPRGAAGEGLGDAGSLKGSSDEMAGNSSEVDSVIAASIAANKPFAEARVAGTPNAWGILAQRWGAPSADASKITQHPQDATYKARGEEKSTAPEATRGPSGAEGAGGDAKDGGSLSDGAALSIPPRGATSSAPAEVTEPVVGGGGIMGTLLGLVRSGSRKAASESAEVDVAASAGLTQLPAGLDTRSTADSAEAPTISAAPDDLSAKAAAASFSMAASVSPGDASPENASTSPDAAAPVTIGKSVVALEAAGVGRGVVTGAAADVSQTAAKPKVEMPTSNGADGDMRVSGSPSGVTAESVPNTNGSSTPAAVEVLPVSTKAGATDADDDPSASGIGRYRVGGVDPISQKVAAELQASVGKGAVGGGKFTISKSAIWRADDRAKAKPVPSDAATGGCWGFGQTGFCCAAPDVTP